MEIGTTTRHGVFKVFFKDLTKKFQTFVVVDEKIQTLLGYTLVVAKQREFFIIPKKVLNSCLELEKWWWSVL